MSNELAVPKTVICPADERETALDFVSFDNTNVSYFVGTDAVDIRPNMILAGDRNVAINGLLLSGARFLRTNRQPEWTSEMHGHAGNIALADGSVQRVTSEGLRKQLAVSGDDRNRIVLPQ